MVDRCKPNRGPSAWCLGLVVGIASSPAPAGDKALGEYLSSECVTCHQLSGRQQPGIPSIIGIPETRFAELLHEYKAKRRSNPVMQTITAKFSADEIAALAAYFASLKPKR
jgi:cytochrome c553